MYAIIRTGGRQAKVREGDVIDVERLHADGEVTFTPLLIVDAKGKVISGKKELATATVTAKVLGESAGDKIDIFKYKAKTGYRKRGGHRQKYTQIEVTKITGPKSAKASAADAEGTAAAEPVEKAATAAPKPKAATAAKPKAAPATAESAAKAPAKKAPVAAKKAPAKKTAATGETKKAPAKKPSADKTPAKKAPAKKAPAKKKDEEG